MNKQTLLPGSVWFLSPTLVVSLLTFVLASCRPDLPVPSSNPFSNVEPAEFVVRTEPEAPFDAIPRVLRVHVNWPEVIDKERLFLIRGEVSDYHLHQIERNDLTKTLEERIVPAMVWAEDEQHFVLAPTVVLEPGQTYTLASGEPSKTVPLVVRTNDELPLLSRFWPPPELPTGEGIFCGAEVLPNIAMPTNLDPFGPRGIFWRGLTLNGPGQRCLRFRFLGRLKNDDEGPWVLPPLIESPGLSGSVFQIEPTSFTKPGESGESIQPSECERDEIPFGPGCALVSDDRIFVSAPNADLLWGISGEGMDRVLKTAPNERFVIKDLMPETAIRLDVVSVDPFGRTQQEIFTAKTSSLSAHVVLNEVMANPVGPEPGQEWVELYNDGQVEASLLGYLILDTGGKTALPDVVLPPGQFAVVVNESYVEDAELDAVPPKDALIVRVPALGKNGLSNSGELLRLVDPEGRTISRFPATPKPKSGASVSRQTGEVFSVSSTPSMSFAITEPSPGLRNFAAANP